MKRFSLRTQIVGVFVLFYGALFILLLMWMMQHIQSDFLEEVDAELHETANSIEEILLRGDSAIDSLQHSLRSMSALFPLPRKLCIRRGEEIIHRCANHPLADDLRVADGVLEYLTITQGDEWYRLIVMHNGAFTIQVAERITATEHTVNESFLLIVISIPFVILISIVGGYFFVRRILRPLDQISSKAKQITSENLNERIPVPKTDDEINRVVTTLNNMVERLENSFSQLEQFSANASHELRTPLTILKGELEVILQQPREPEEYRSVLESNLEEVKRIAKTVESLFVMAKIDSKALVLEREPVELLPLLEEITSEARHLADGSEIEIESNLLPVQTVKGDVVMLVQLFLNLIENAIKYNRPGGTVRITLREKPSMARIDITDTGIGIPSEEQHRIYDRFYRVDKAMARRQGGAGLGLSLAKWIVDMHDGRITLQSTPGRGSTFSVFLPLS
ncbi:MAG: hypothetical protein C0600_08985 [Ignavibacteria bacterium]|nr:MAG: hypothetical protein C0600_08985 [Ignavibacteria bacterium]